jgi:hypothetical protein
MTQSVAVHFTSPQFDLESGTVLFTKGARLFSDGEFSGGTLTHGRVDDVLVEGPIKVDAMLVGLTVVARDGGRRYRVAYLKVAGDLREEELSAGRVTIHLSLPVVVIVRIEDSSGNRVSNVRVSLLLPDLEASLEAETDDRGEVVLIGGPGRYTAVIDAFHGTRIRPTLVAHLEITSADIGERIMLLRLQSTNLPI